MGEIVRACLFCHSCYILSSHCHYFGHIYAGKRLDMQSFVAYIGVIYAKRFIKF